MIFYVRVCRWYFCGLSNFTIRSISRAVLRMSSQIRFGQSWLRDSPRNLAVGSWARSQAPKGKNAMVSSMIFIISIWKIDEQNMLMISDYMWLSWYTGFWGTKDWRPQIFQMCQPFSNTPSARCNLLAPPSGGGNPLYGLLGGDGMLATHMLPHVCGSAQSLWWWAAGRGAPLSISCKNLWWRRIFDWNSTSLI